uniref:Uncharacterized protein n=1 Tax=Arundo donax TaxID=35708 RepID=A0A0A9TCH7_ARUDO
MNIKLHRSLNSTRSVREAQSRRS